MTDMGREARFEITQVIIPGWQSGKNISEVNKMREGIHPKYYQAKVTCNCGNEFVTGSTKPEIHVEICSKCHSFYTGQQKAASARGRIDKFNRKYGINSTDPLPSGLSISWRPARRSADATALFFHCGE